MSISLVVRRIRKAMGLDNRLDSLSGASQIASLPAAVSIHDRDGNFTQSFVTVFRSEGLTVIRTSVKAPNANSRAERWIRSARADCLDKIMVINPAHLHSVMTEYIDFYNACRPHQCMGRQTPIIRLPANHAGPVRKRPH